MPKLKEITVTYGRKQSTGNYSNIDLQVTATVEPDKNESSDVAALKAMAYCRHHVMTEMSGAFPSLRQKLDGLWINNFLYQQRPFAKFTTLAVNSYTATSNLANYTL